MSANGNRLKPEETHHAVQISNYRHEWKLEHGVRYMNLQTMYLLVLLNPGCLRKFKLKVQFMIREGYTSLLFIVLTSSSSADVASLPSSPYSKKYKGKVFTKVA
jgi:hypothetical protein